jgi:hypothetical protein
LQEEGSAGDRFVIISRKGVMKVTTATLEREELEQVVHRLPDDKVRIALDFIHRLDDIDEYEPNAETVAAMREAEHPEDLKSYAGIEEMFRDFGVDPYAHA